MNGQAASSVVVQVLDRQAYQGNRTFTVTLSNPTGADLGNPAVASVIIVDKEPPPVWQITGTLNIRQINAGEVREQRP